MYKLKLLVIVGVLALTSLTTTSFVLASTPQHEVTPDLKDSFNTTTNQTLGRILITRKEPVGEEKNTDIITSITLQRNDFLRWEGNNSIIVKDNTTIIGVVASGERLAMQNTGTYTYHPNGNTTNTATITVIPEPTETLTITTQGDPFEITHSNKITINNQEHYINLTINIPQDTSPGDHPITIKLNSPYKNTTINHTITILEDRGWKLTENQPWENTTRITMRAGEAKSIGEVFLESTGNTNVELNTLYLGNGSGFLQTQKRQTLFKKSTTFFGLTLLVPQRQEEGTYNTTLLITGAGKQVTIPLLVKITDTISPEFKSITFDEDRVWHDMEVVVEVSDNIGVVNMTISWDNQTRQMRQDQQLWIYNTTLRVPGTYNFTFCARDNPGNKNCTTREHTMKKLDLITGNNSIELPKKKYGSFTLIQAFNITESPIPNGSVFVKLLDFTTNLQNVSEKTFRIRLTDNEGAVRDFEQTGQEIEIKAGGPVKLSVRSEELATFEGVLGIRVPGYALNESNIAFSGRFLEYDVPQPFTISDWYGGKPFSCEVIDTGNLETSFYTCEVQFPIGIDVEELAIPTTPGEKRLEDDKLNTTISGYETREGYYKAGLSGIIGVCAFVLVLLWFTINVYPYQRIRKSVKGGDIHGNAR